MKCPECGHTNLSDFPFCESCLAVVPKAAGRRAVDAFDLDEATAEAASHAFSSHWPPFPWNPPDLPDPLIGRDKQLKQLVAGWDDVVSHWRGRIHLLVSEYGLGKSRVSSALVAAARKREPETRVIRVVCPAYGGAYRMWDALLRAAFEIPEAADAIEAGARLIKAVESYLAEDPAEAAGLISYLTGYEAPGRPEPSPGLQEQALTTRSAGALARLLATVAIERPVLMIVDRANRASAESLALAGAMEATLKGRPFMLVLAGSPELTEILPGWQRFPATRLGPLSRKDAERMLSLFLEGLDKPPSQIVDRVLSRAGGNPSALKSMVRYLREAGGITMADGHYAFDEGVIWDLELPDDLEGVVLARLGTLADKDRRILARAAVIGKQFWIGALVTLERLEAPMPSSPGEIASDGVPAAIRASLERLAKLKFVEQRPSRLPGEESWAFNSTLHWRLAKELLPQATRQRFHRIICQWLLCQAGYGSAEQLEDLANHAEEAGDPGEAARYLVEAARRYRRRHRPSDERRVLLGARALARPGDIATRVTIAFDLGDALKLLGDVDRALESYQEALSLAWRMRQRRQGAKALARIGRVEMDRGELNKAYDKLVAAMRLFEAVGNRPGVASACNDVGRIFWLEGRFEEALRCYTKAETIFRQLKDRQGLAETVHLIAAHHYDRGDLAVAEEYYRDALDLRRRIDDRHGMARTLNDIGIVWMTNNQLVRAGEAWQEALELAREVGDRSMEATLANNLGEGLVLLGRIDDAHKSLTRAFELAGELNLPRIAVDARLNMGQLHAKRGEWEQAEAALADAKARAEALQLPRLIELVDRGHGDLEMARLDGAEVAAKERQQRAERAQQAFKRSAEQLEKQGYLLEAAISLERLASAYDLIGKDMSAVDARKRAKKLRASHDRPKDAEAETPDAP